MRQIEEPSQLWMQWLLNLFKRDATQAAEKRNDP